MDWPAQSPDLSPIENVWHWMKLRISAQRHRITNVAQMATAIEKTWAEVPTDLLAKLVNWNEQKDGSVETVKWRTYQVLASILAFQGASCPGKWLLRYTNLKLGT